MVRTCPICKTQEHEVITPLCSNMKILGQHFKDEPANIVCCKGCGLVYVDVDESQDAFNKHYDSDYALTPSYDELYTPEVAKQYFDDWYNEIKDYINYDSYILDVGGGLGHFLKYLKDMGYKNVYLLDISHSAIKSAQEKGLNTILSDGINLPDEIINKFDMVMYANSIEHFYNMNDVFEGARKLMKDDGYLYIELPDADKYCEMKNAPYMLFTIEHLYHFNIKTMENIARAFSFDIINKKQTIKCGGFNVLRTTFQKNKKIENTVYDSSCKESILRYIDFSDKILNIIDKYKKSQEPLILWGIGASTVLLLNKNFDECNVIQLIDRNSARQGLKYKIGKNTYTIEDPTAITDEKATILIMPFWYRDSILKTIQSYNFKNKVEILI